MTDKELLELAAKAAKIDGYWIELCPEDGHPTYSCGIGKVGRITTLWNPLADDGDALRLAVRLGLGISIPLGNKRTDVVTFTGPLVSVIEAHGDPFAATRRAIVRAAAEIGKELKA